MALVEQVHASDLVDRCSQGTPPHSPAIVGLKLAVIVIGLLVEIRDAVRDKGTPPEAIESATAPAHKRERRPRGQ